MTYLSTPDQAYAFLRKVWPSEISTREKVLIVYLTTSYQVIGHEVLFIGGYDSCVLDTRVALSCAARENARAILLAHNHPSGSLAPSNECIFRSY